MARTSSEIRDLGTSAQDRELLRAFYTDLFVPAFVDADERESLANIQRYLELKAAGWYGPNNYHIRVLLDGDRVVGGTIADYLAAPNVGVVEFLVTAPDRRERGLGRRLLDDVEAALDEDARLAGTPGLRAVVAEMNDPFHSSLARDSMDPFTRLLIWSRWGYLKLDFPYVQPALSAAQRPVASMLLAWKPMCESGDAVAADTVKDVVHEYMRWAMRIEQPKGSAEFTSMARHLDGRTQVALLPLDQYAGYDRTRPLTIREVTAADPDLPAVRRLYEASFRDRATALDPTALGSEPGGVSRHGEDHVYHLWALRSTPEAPVAGLASFFTLRNAGFGGYVALAPPLRRTGRLPLVLARIEAQMVRDALGAIGWYVECDDAVLATLRRAGFHEVPVPYRQPSLRPGGPSPALHLLYKPFGRVYAPPTLTGAALLEALRRIQHVVYAIERPEETAVYRELARQLHERAIVPLR
jgi:GNAT superfamily N-acetyltransferase